MVALKSATNSLCSIRANNELVSDKLVEETSLKYVLQLASF